MLNQADMLNSIRKTTQMGRQGILEMMERTKDPAFQKELQRQLDEYETIYESADAMLMEEGGTREDISPAARLSFQVMTAVKTMRDPSVSHLAEMMIQGNTMGVTKILQNVSEYNGKDARVSRLAEQMVRTEEENIEGLKAFL